jgi:hypothetical protein
MCRPSAVTEGTAQRVVVLAMAVVLASDAITSPSLHWLNVGVVVLSVGAILVQVWWDRRRKTPWRLRIGDQGLV